MLITPPFHFLQPFNEIGEPKIASIDGPQEIGLKVLLRNANGDFFSPQKLPYKDITLCQNNRPNQFPRSGTTFIRSHDLWVWHSGSISLCCPCFQAKLNTPILILISDFCTKIVTVF